MVGGVSRCSKGDYLAYDCSRTHWPSCFDHGLALAREIISYCHIHSISHCDFTVFDGWSLWSNRNRGVAADSSFDLLGSTRVCTHGESIEIFFNETFDINRPFTKSDLDMISMIYKNLDRNLNI